VGADRGRRPRALAGGLRLWDAVGILAGPPRPRARRPTRGGARRWPQERRWVAALDPALPAELGLGAGSRLFTSPLDGRGPGRRPAAVPSLRPTAGRLRSSDRTLAQPNAASFARRLVLPCRAGTTPGRTDTGTGPLASLLTSRSTSGLPVMLTGHWSSLQLATGALRSRLLRQRAGV
jgi:hypothetical protein